MKQHQTNSHKVFAYLKNGIKQKVKTQKLPLVTFFLFIIVFICSFLWSNGPLPNATVDYNLAKEEMYHCTLHRIIDGDTVVANCPLKNPKLVNIRIWGMDAPETNQIPWGEKATNALNRIFLMNKHDIITILIRDIDQYNRYVGQIFINNKEIDVGLQMVSEVFAVVYKQYNNDPQYLYHEDLAKSHKKGIWQHPGSQQNPAAWRKVNPF